MSFTTEVLFKLEEEFDTSDCILPYEWGRIDFIGMRDSSLTVMYFKKLNKISVALDDDRNNLLGIDVLVEKKSDLFSYSLKGIYMNHSEHGKSILSYAIKEEDKLASKHFFLDNRAKNSYDQINWEVNDAAFSKAERAFKSLLKKNDLTNLLYDTVY